MVDRAAPVLTYIVLSVYGDLVSPADPARYRQTPAFITMLVINVITI